MPREHWSQIKYILLLYKKKILFRYSNLENILIKMEETDTKKTQTHTYTDGRFEAKETKHIWIGFVVKETDFGHW